MRHGPPLVLEDGRRADGSALGDVLLAGGRVSWVGEGPRPADAVRVALEGRVVLPGLVNAHDHLDFSTFPALGRPPYRNVYEWAADVDAGAGDPRAMDAQRVPLVDRLWLGGVRNLLAGVTAVAHHGPFHRSLARPDFPVYVLEKYEFAHSPGLTPDLRRTYRTTDRRIPWMVHLGEGTDARVASEVDALAEHNVLRQNTVAVHAITLRADDPRRLAEARAAVVWCPESNRRLYGATADVPALRAAGVRVGLGSDSPVSGVRDALSNLSAAAAEGVVGAAELLAMATTDAAAVARLPVGGPEAGGRADLLVADDVGGLLAGRRGSVALVVRGGHALYGHGTLLGPVRSRVDAVTVDGAPQALSSEVARRVNRILRAAPAPVRAAWLEGVSLL